jgi:sugar phosphate isomerase/epimerase
MNRREMLISVAGGLSASVLGASAYAAAAEEPKKTGLGICSNSYMIGHAFSGSLGFLEHCHSLGAGGMQIGLGNHDEAYFKNLRSKAEEWGMFIEGMTGLPRNEAGLAQFEAQLQAVKMAGGNVVRVVMSSGGRRYETYRTSSYEQFKQDDQRQRQTVELAEPVAAKVGVRLAIENHKDHRIEERVDMLEKLSSEYVGVCMDTANNIALLESPLDTVRALAPWTYSVHLKDQVLEEYEAGFLSGDVPLGKGILNVPEMVRIIREAQPDTNFTTEMHTRDPLRVPCLTAEYWTTMPDVPASDLARVLRVIRTQTSETPMPQVTGLPRDEQLTLEENNVKTCLAYAAENLDL